MELINLKNASLLYFEELRKKIVEVEKKRLVEYKKEYQRTL
jgi:hypothetical protein